MRTATLLLAAMSAPAFADDFRGAAFGMSRAEVRATEPTAEWAEKGNVIAFRTEVADLDVLAQYEFRNDRMHGGGYRVVEEHSNRTLYLNDYETLLSLLTEKYGKPDEDRTVWRNDLYRDDSADWGLAVALGHLIKGAMWQTDTTDITLFLNGDNYNIELLVFYQSRELGAEAAASDRQEDLNNL